MFVSQVGKILSKIIRKNIDKSQYGRIDSLNDLKSKKIWIKYLKDIFLNRFIDQREIREFVDFLNKAELEIFK